MLEQIREHAAREYPRECCGLVILIDGVETYYPCENIAEGMAHFTISPRDYVSAEELGEIAAVVHSHPNGPLRASEADREGCNRTNIPWHIVMWPGGEMITINPDASTLPLLGREFSHGVVDCLTAIRDFYALAGIDIGNYDRVDKWWEKGQTLYDDHVIEEGFVQLEGIDQLMPGDLIFMQIKSDVVNHSAIYLGGNLIYHHLPNRLSKRDVLGGFFLKCTRSVWRHKQWQKSAYTDTLLKSLEAPSS